MIKWGCRHPSHEPQVVQGHRVCGAQECASVLIGARVIYDPATGRFRVEEDDVESISDEEEEMAQSPPRPPLTPRALDFDEEDPVLADATPPRKESSHSLPVFTPTPTKPYPSRWRSSPQGQAEYRRRLLLDPRQHKGENDELDRQELREWILEPILRRDDEAQDLQFLSTVIHYFDQGTIYQRLIPDNAYYHEVLDAACALYVFVLLYAPGIPHTDHVLIPQRYDRADELGGHTVVTWQYVSREQAIQWEYDNRPSEHRTTPQQFSESL